MNDQVKRLGPAHFLVNDKPVYVPESPRQLGLNARTWRPGQQEAVAWLVSHQSKTQVIEAPTGWGKSLLLLATGLLSVDQYDGNAFLLTATKNLQEKELGEYPDLNVLKGMNAYPCLIDPLFNVEQARCHGGFKCPSRLQCDYYAARDRVPHVPMTSMNYHYYMTSRLYSQSLPAPTVLLGDEVHNLERVVMGAVSVSITEGQCKAAGIPGPPSKLDRALLWANRYVRRVQHQQYLLEERRKQLMKTDEELTRKERALLRTLTALGTAMDNLLRTQTDATNWVLERADQHDLEIKPIFVHDYANRILWHPAGRVVLTSATLPKHDQFARMLGLPDWTSVTLPSLFPVENRPVLIDPIQESMSHKNAGPGTRAWDQMVAKIDDIIDMWPQKKGFIHSVSYARAEYIYTKSRHQAKMVPPVKEGLSSVLDAWTLSNRPRWMVSPSIWEGIDQGADEHNAVQIIPKLAYPTRKSPQIKARIEQDPDWDPFQVGLFLVQATGRGIRHANDQCVTYITDPAINWWLEKYNDYVPNWWLASIQDRKGPRYPKLVA